MAHSGDGTEWSESTPAGTEPIYLGALEIRDLRKALNLRIKKEHEIMATSTAGAEHKQGSAKAYLAAAASEPTKRPDGSTVFTAADIGRLWLDSTNTALNVLISQTGPVWWQVGVPSGTKMWFYANTAPVGWTIISAIGDELLAVKGGSTYTAGGAQAGAWSHDHSGSSGAVTLTSAQSGLPAHLHTQTGQYLNNGDAAGGEGVLTNSGSYNTGTVSAANAASSHAHSVAAETAYRPDARVGILCTKD